MYTFESRVTFVFSKLVRCKRREGEREGGRKPTQAPHFILFRV